MGLLTQMLAEKHQSSQRKEQQQFDAYKSILSSPDATDEGKEYALTQIMGLAGVDGGGVGGKGKGGGGGGGIGGKVGKGVEAALPIFKHLLGIGGGGSKDAAQAGGPVEGVVGGGVAGGGVGAGGAGTRVDSDYGQSTQTPPSPSPSPAPSSSPSPSPSPSLSRPRLLMTNSERLQRDREQAVAGQQIKDDGAFNLYNREADADQSRTIGGIGKTAQAKADAYNKLVSGGMDKTQAAAVLGLKEPPPPTVKKVEYDTKIGADGKPHKFKITHMTDGTTQEEEDVAKTGTDKPELTGVMGELAKAQEILADKEGKYSATQKVAAGKFIKNYDAGTNNKVQISLNANGPIPDKVTDYWADNYKLTGQFPPYGVLKAYPKLGKSIVDRVAMSGDTAGAVRAKQDMMTALNKSLTAQQTTLAQITPYEKTAGANMDRAISKYKQLSTLKSPILNAPYRTWQREFQGNSQLAVAEAARTAAVSEISNVLSYGKGVISDEKLKHAGDLLNSNYNLKSLIDVADLLHKDMTTRIDEQKKEVQHLHQQIASGGFVDSPEGDGSGGGAGNGGGEGGGVEVWVTGKDGKPTLQTSRPK